MVLEGPERLFDGKPDEVRQQTHDQIDRIPQYGQLAFCSTFTTMIVPAIAPDLSVNVIGNGLQNGSRSGSPLDHLDLLQGLADPVETLVEDGSARGSQQFFASSVVVDVDWTIWKFDRQYTS